MQITKDMIKKDLISTKVECKLGITLDSFLKEKKFNINQSGM